MVSDSLHLSAELLEDERATSEVREEGESLAVDTIILDHNESPLLTVNFPTFHWAWLKRKDDTQLAFALWRGGITRGIFRSLDTMFETRCSDYPEPLACVLTSGFARADYTALYLSHLSS